MAVSVTVYSHHSSSTLAEAGVSALEDDLHELLTGVGEATGSGTGCGLWSVDLVLADGVCVNEWIERLLAFLREWGVPEDTRLEVSGRAQERLCRQVFPGPVPPVGEQEPVRE